MTPRLLTASEAIERITGVLLAAGIRLELYGPRGIEMDVQFPDGAKGFFNVTFIECDGISHQRG